MLTCDERAHFEGPVRRNTQHARNTKLQKCVPAAEGMLGPSRPVVCTKIGAKQQEQGKDGQDYQVKSEHMACGANVSELEVIQKDKVGHKIEREHADEHVHGDTHFA